jgi:hypothetical protein
MLSDNVSIALNRFAKHVVTQSRANLTRGNKNVNRALYESITAELFVGKNSFGLSFEMEDYGQFQDLGVKGANPQLVKGGQQKAPNSPFSFKNKRPPSQFIAEWAKARNIRLRDEKGRFKKGNYDTIGIILANRIFAQGIKPSLFFTRPFEAAFANLPDELIEAFELDLESLLTQTTK